MAADSFSALTVQVKWPEGHPACRNLTEAVAIEQFFVKSCGDPVWLVVISGKVGWLNISQK